MSGTLSWRSLWSKLDSALGAKDEKQAKTRVRAVLKTIAPQAVFMEDPQRSEPVSWIYFIVAFFVLLLIMVVLGARFGFIRVQWKTLLSSYSISSLVARVRIWCGVTGLRGLARVEKDKQKRILARRQAELERDADNVTTKKTGKVSDWFAKVSDSLYSQTTRGLKVAAVAALSGTAFNVISVLPENLRQQLFESAVVVGVLYVAKFLLQFYYLRTKDVDPIWVRLPQYVFTTYYEFLARRSDAISAKSKGPTDSRVIAARNALATARKLTTAVESANGLSLDPSDFSRLLNFDKSKTDAAQVTAILKRLQQKAQAGGTYQCYIPYTIGDLSSCTPVVDVRVWQNNCNALLKEFANVSHTYTAALGELATIPDRVTNKFRQNRKYRSGEFSTRFYKEVNRNLYKEKRDNFTDALTRLRNKVMDLRRFLGPPVVELNQVQPSNGLLQSLFVRLQDVEDWGGPFTVADTNARFFSLSTSRKFKGFGENIYRALTNLATELELFYPETLESKRPSNNPNTIRILLSLLASQERAVYPTKTETFEIFSTRITQTFYNDPSERQNWTDKLNLFSAGMIRIMRAIRRVWAEGVIAQRKSDKTQLASVQAYDVWIASALFPFVSNTNLRL